MVSRVNLLPVPAVDTSTDKSNRGHAEHPEPQKPGTSGRTHSRKSERDNFLTKFVGGGKRASSARRESTAKIGNAGLALGCQLIEAFGADERVDGLLRLLEGVLGPQATATQLPGGADLVSMAISWFQTGGSPGQENDNVGARDASAPGFGGGPANEVGKPEGR